MGAETAAAAAIASLVIGGATAATTGYMSYEAARRQNAAIRKGQEHAKRAAELQRQQVSQAAAIERQKHIDEAQRVTGRIRVAAASADVGLASFEGLETQAMIDAGKNIRIIDTNQANAIRRIESGYQADFDRLNANISNSILQAFMGGMQGYATGLQIGQATTSTVRAIGAGDDGSGNGGGRRRGVTPLTTPEGSYGPS